MAVYDTTPTLLLLTANINRKLLVAADTGNPLDRQLKLTNGDTYIGALYVVDQPAGPGTPFNFYVPIVTGSSIALTNGVGVHYADATSVALVQQVTTNDPTDPNGLLGAVIGPDLNVVTGGTQAGLTFMLTVASTTLTTALMGVGSLQAFIEIRCVFAGSPSQVLVVDADPVTINASALYPPPARMVMAEKQTDKITLVTT